MYKYGNNYTPSHTEICDSILESIPRFFPDITTKVRILLQRIDDIYILAGDVDREIYYEGIRNILTPLKAKQGIACKQFFLEGTREDVIFQAMHSQLDTMLLGLDVLAEFQKQIQAQTSPAHVYPKYSQQVSDIVDTEVYDRCYWEAYMLFFHFPISVQQVRSDFVHICVQFPDLINKKPVDQMVQRQIAFARMVCWLITYHENREYLMTHGGAKYFDSVSELIRKISQSKPSKEAENFLGHEEIMVDLYKAMAKQVPYEQVDVLQLPFFAGIHQLGPADFPKEYEEKS